MRREREIAKHSRGVDQAASRPYLSWLPSHRLFPIYIQASSSSISVAYFVTTSRHGILPQSALTRHRCLSPRRSFLVVKASGLVQGVRIRAPCPTGLPRWVPRGWTGGVSPGGPAATTASTACQHDATANSRREQRISGGSRLPDQPALFRLGPLTWQSRSKAEGGMHG
jgi:hypothetical protein